MSFLKCSNLKAENVIHFVIIQNFYFFTTFFYSESSISEKTGRKRIKVYIFRKLFSRPSQQLKLDFSRC